MLKKVAFSPRTDVMKHMMYLLMAQVYRAEEASGQPGSTPAQLLLKVKQNQGPAQSPGRMKPQLFALSPFSLTITGDLPLLFAALQGLNDSLYRHPQTPLSRMIPPLVPTDVRPSPHVFSILVRGLSPAGSSKHECSSSPLPRSLLFSLLFFFQPCSPFAIQSGQLESSTVAPCALCLPREMPCGRRH